MKRKTWNLIKNVLRYLLPAILGWLEGDSHAVVNALSGLLTVIF